MQTKGSQSIQRGDGGSATISRASARGLPAPVDTTLNAPVTKALSDFEHQVVANACTSACTPASFTATFAVGRSDTSIVSGTWTISTYFPGGAHPETTLVGVTARSADGTAVAAAELFAGNELVPLVSVLRPALTSQLNKIGCNELDPSDVETATAGTAANYSGVAVTSTGLLVGISDDAVAPHACGDFEVPIGWSAVRAGLSPLGLAIASSAALPAADTTAARCSAGVLDVAFGTQTQIATGQFQLPVVFTNTSGQSCTLKGFPGVDLTGSALSGGGSTLSLRRSSATPANVTLAAGASGHAELTYLAGPAACDAGGTAWTPDGAHVTPPDETLSIELFWSGQSVDDCQSGATHPGTYIGPVLPGA